jgi:hypothetical protein
MEYVILAAIIIAYVSLSGELSSIKSKLENKPKTKVNLKELVGKNVKVYLDDEYDLELEGELLSFDRKWFELRDSRKKNEIHYKRTDRIKSITLKND